MNFSLFFLVIPLLPGGAVLFSILQYRRTKRAALEIANLAARFCWACQEKDVHLRPRHHLGHPRFGQGE